MTGAGQPGQQDVDFDGVQAGGSDHRLRVHKTLHTEGVYDHQVRGTGV
jgi:hypothetical protein